MTNRTRNWLLIVAVAVLAIVAAVAVVRRTPSLHTEEDALERAFAAGTGPAH